MLYTKRHYTDLLEFMARQAYQVRHIKAYDGLFDTLVSNLADHLASDNSLFNRQRFNEYWERQKYIADELE